MPLGYVKHGGAPFPHRVNEAAPIRRELATDDWHDTNAAGRSLVLRRKRKEYAVAVGDQKKLFDLGLTVSGLSYCFHVDGARIAIAAGARALVVDMRDGEVVSEQKLGAAVGSIAFTRDGVLVTSAGALIDFAVDDGGWKERWRLPAKGLEVWGTGTPGLVGLSGRRAPMVWAVARPDGVVALCRQTTPRTVRVVWYRDGRTAMCGEYTPAHETCTEIVDGEDAVREADGAALTTDLDVAALEQLPKIGRPRKKTMAKKKAAKATKKTAKGAKKKAAKQPKLPDDLPTFTRAVCTLVAGAPKAKGKGVDASALLALDLPADLRTYVELVAPRLRDTAHKLDLFAVWDIRFGLEPLERNGSIAAVGVGVTAGGVVQAVRLGDFEGGEMVEVYSSFEGVLSSEAMRRDEPDPRLDGLLPDDLFW